MNETKPSYSQEPSVVPAASTAESVHMPRLFVPDKCIQTCGKLRARAANAVLEAATHPTQQIDVVCHGAGRILKSCGAELQEAGTYGNEFGRVIEGEAGYFLVNPVVYTSATRSRSAPGEIERSIAEGSTAHSIHEL